MNTKTHIPTIFYFAGAVLLSILAQHTPALMSVFSVGTSGFYLSLTLLLLVGYGTNFLATEKQVPVFVWAILFGMALQPLFGTLTTHTSSLTIVVELLATYILFMSGLYVPVQNFKKYFGPIATLSILGTLLTVFFFAITLSVLTTAFNFVISPMTLLILAAILSSIDPSVVMTTLHKLHFKRPFLRDIAISESALNDVVGVIITRFFLIAGVGASASITVSEGFFPILSQQALRAYTVELVWGVFIGALGAWILKTWGESVGKRHWSDHGLFIIVPLFCFALGSLFGGTGFLAAFIAGLLFETGHATKHVEDTLDGVVDRFLKPVTFVLMGALVPLSLLTETMAIGTFSAIIFMFVIRPFIVFISLLPWMLPKQSVLHFRDAVFLSCIRETGTVPAVLLLLTAVLGIMQADFIFAIGVWVILYTLTIEPPLTKLLAQKIGVVEEGGTE